MTIYDYAAIGILVGAVLWGAIRLFFAGPERGQVARQRRGIGAETVTLRRFWHKADIATVLNDVRFWG